MCSARGAEKGGATSAQIDATPNRPRMSRRMGGAAGWRASWRATAPVGLVREFGSSSWFNRDFG